MPLVLLGREGEAADIDPRARRPARNGRSFIRTGCAGWWSRNPSR